MNVLEITDPNTAKKSCNWPEGVVYAVNFGGDRFKIGRTYCPYQRLNTLRNACLHISGNAPIQYLITPDHKNYQTNEIAVHRALKAYRQKGEFFNCTAAQVIRQFNNLTLIPWTDEEEAEEKRKNVEFWDNFAKGGMSYAFRQIKHDQPALLK